MLTNTGQSPLHWKTTISGSGASLLQVTPGSGTLAPGTSVQLTIAPDVANAQLGTFPATITVVSTGDPNMQSQAIPVTITINSAEETSTPGAGTSTPGNATSTPGGSPATTVTVTSGV